MTGNFENAWPLLHRPALLLLGSALLIAALASGTSQPAQAADLTDQQMASSTPLAVGAKRIGLCEEHELVSSGNAYRSWPPVYKIDVAKAGNYALVFDVSDDAGVVDWAQVKDVAGTITVNLDTPASSGWGDVAALLFDSSGGAVQEAGGFSHRKSGCTTGYKLSRGSYYAAGYAISLVERPGFSLSLTKSTSLASAKITLSKKSYDISDDDINVPEASVSLGGVELEEYRDYGIKYRGQNKVGTATAIITGRGLYYGTRTVKYLILPPSTKIESAKTKRAGSVPYVGITWRRVSECSGYQIRYTRNKSMAGAAKVDIPRKKTSANIGIASKAKRISLQIRSYKTVKGKRYYSRWSSKRTIMVRL